MLNDILIGTLVLVDVSAVLQALLAMGFLKEK